MKRDEIEVLRLIGASKWYIQAILAEGVLFGFTSATLAFVIFTAFSFTLAILVLIFGRYPTTCIL